MTVKKSAEDYMETILILGEHVHAVDIAAKMCISKAAVTKAVKSLVGDGCAAITDHHITLTEKGRAHAEKIYSRHKLITEFWIALGVSGEEAERQACQMEHILGEETIKAIRRFIDGTTRKDK